MSVKLRDKLGEALVRENNLIVEIAILRKAALALVRLLDFPPFMDPAEEKQLKALRKLLHE